MCYPVNDPGRRTIGGIRRDETATRGTQLSFDQAEPRSTHLVRSSRKWFRSNKSPQG